MDEGITVRGLGEALVGLDPDMPVLVVREYAAGEAYGETLPVIDLTDTHYRDGTVQLHINVA
jgi:hypothetical protein